MALAGLVCDSTFHIPHFTFNISLDSSVVSFLPLYGEMISGDPMNLEYFHPLFVHFPVALTLTGAVLLLYGTAGGNKDLLRAGLLVLIIGGAMVIPTYITGQVARAVLEDSSAFDRDLPTLDTHEDLGLASLAVLVALGIVAGLTLGKWDPEARHWGVVALALAAALLIGVTAFYGGRLVFEQGIGVRIEAPLKR